MSDTVDFGKLCLHEMYKYIVVIEVNTCWSFLYTSYPRLLRLFIFNF